MAKATVGVSDHGGWAVLVTMSAGELVDRRRVELVEEGLPAIPHHVDAQLVPLDEGVALVERVRASAIFAARARRARNDVEGIGAIALRECPPLPATIEECITNVRARNNADWVMYREVLAGAARELGWKVVWFAAKTLTTDDARSRQIGKALGPPWTVDHRLAMAAALAATEAMRCVQPRSSRRNREATRCEEWLLASVL